MFEPLAKKRFHWQKSDERIVFAARRFFPSFFVPMVSLGGSFFFTAGIVVVFLEGQWLYQVYYELINTAILVWLGVGLLWMIYLWYEWFFDICVITDRRLVDIDQEGFFHQRFSEAGLEKIEDVTYEVRGVLQTLFNFGNVVVYTSGSEQGFTFEHVANPQAVRERLMALLDGEMAYAGGESSDPRDATLAEDTDKPLTAREVFQYFQQRDAVMLGKDENHG